MIKRIKNGTASRPCTYCLVLMLSTLALLGGAASLSAEDGEKEKPKHRLGYYQIADSVHYLQSSLYVSSKTERTDVEGAAILFYIVTDTGQVLISEAVTDANGLATAILPDLSIYRTDTLGTVAFLAEFRGNDLYTGKDADVTIQALEVKLEFEERDSARSISVVAKNPVTGGLLEGVGLNVYVARMFKHLQVGSLSTDSDGWAELEFPADIPGDLNGNLNVMIKMEDDENYGNFEYSDKVAWGTRLIPTPHHIQRALWSPYAPVWMVLIFLILMVTVWGHYIVIVWMLAKMKSYRKGQAMQWD